MTIGLPRLSTAGENNPSDGSMAVALLPRGTQFAWIMHAFEKQCKCTFLERVITLEHRNQSRRKSHYQLGAGHFDQPLETHIFLLVLVVQILHQFNHHFGIRFRFELVAFIGLEERS